MSRIELFFPMILLAVSPRFDQDGCLIFDKQTRFVGGQGDASGAKSFILFTNAAAATSYARLAGANCEMVFIDTKEAAKEIALRAKESHKCSVVVFDPSSSRRVPGIPIDDFIAACDSSPNTTGFHN